MCVPVLCWEVQRNVKFLTQPPLFLVQLNFSKFFSIVSLILYSDWKIFPGVGSSDALCVVLAQLIDGWNNGLKRPPHPFRLHLQIRPTTRINTSQWGSATSFTLLSELAGNSGGNYPTLKGTASQRMAGNGGLSRYSSLKGAASQDELLKGEWTERVRKSNDSMKNFYVHVWCLTRVVFCCVSNT